MNKQHLPIWIIWFALIQGMLIIIFLLGGGIPELSFNSPDTFDILYIIPFAPLIIALVIRVAILPKIALDNAAAILSTCIIGIAMCEGSVIMSLLLSNDYHLYNSISLVGAILIAIAYIPLYLNKKSQDKSFYQTQK